MAVRFQDQIDDTTADGEQEDFRGGADEFSTPTKLAEEQSGRLLNCLVEDNGRPKSRPGADALGGSALTASRIDRLIYFDTPTTELLFASVAASLRKWDTASWTNIGGYPFGANSIADMAQLNNLLYCTDANGQWQSYSGAAWSGALGNTATDPPVGASILCVHTDRIFASGTIGGVNDQIHASALGAAGTGNWNSATFAFRVGRGEGEAIVSMVSGKGQWLAVGKEGSIFMALTDPTAVSAAEWIVQRLAANVGVVGKRAMVAFGDSIFVLSRDGVREIAATEAPDTPWELGAPMSQPLQPYIDRITWASASKSVLHKYRHYLFVAVPLDGATEPSHVLVWNGRTRSWMGVWTGWTPTAMATSRFGSQGDRFIIGDSAGKVNAWKDYADEDLDATYDDNGTGVATTIRGRSWNFGSQRNLKDGASLELDFVDSRAVVAVSFVADTVERRQWTENLASAGLSLPFTLPATLPETRPVVLTKSLDGIEPWRECYIEVATSSKRVELKRMSLEAWLNTYETE